MSTRHFVDPRTAPVPTVARVPPRFTPEWNALDGLHQLCRDGRTYDVERWIMEGRPLQVAEVDLPRRGRRNQTALEIALEDGNHALALLLLLNGYDPNQTMGSPLDQPLRDRRWDLVDLLLEWGADPQDVDLETLFGTYQTSLIERFRALGVDLTADHALAATLAYHTSNKPLFGIARRHRVNDPRIQRELNIALRHHAEHGHEKGVMLSLWAGADAHAPALSLNYDVRVSDDVDEDDDDCLGVSAVWQACCSGQHEILDRLKPDPNLDDFQSLYCVAKDSATIAFLVRIAPPLRPGTVISSLIRDVSWRSTLRWGHFGYSHYESIRALKTLFEAGVRWRLAEGDEAGAVRASLIKLPDDSFVEIVKVLTTGDYCSPNILREIARTPAMRKRMKDVGFIPPDPDDRKRPRRDPPTRSREVLNKLGVELPKPLATDVSLPREVSIGVPRPGARMARISRQGLYERVWSTPVETLAKEWGLSGRGLAKACGRIRVPVPPRGYWARLSSGQRVLRARLPVVKQGEAEVIVVWEDMITSERNASS